MASKLQIRQTPVMPSGKLVEFFAELEWYAVRTPPMKEFVAQELLTQRGLVTFVPADKRWKRQNRFTKVKALKSFPVVNRYVFVGFAPGMPAWFSLFQLPCVQGCAGINGKPMKLENSAMERLLRMFPNGIQRPTGERTYDFKAGDVVRICEGPFDGMVVPIHELKGNDAIVFMELFGSSQRVKLNASLLEAA